MADDLKTLVDDAVWSMRDGDDGTAVGAVVRLQTHPPGEVLAQLADRLMAQTDGTVPRVLLPLDSAGRLPDDRTIHELEEAIADGDPQRLRSIAGDSYDGLLVLLLGAIARTSPHSASSANPAGSRSNPQDGDEPDEAAMDGFELSPSTTISLDAVALDSEAGPNFGRVTREHVEWALDVLARVVAPALRMGKDADYFTERDATEGLLGERSYAGVYRWFYTPTHGVKLATRHDGRFDVIDGRSRIHVASEIGLSELPAYVR